jgi:iron complex outermembrane recepter protein
MVIRGLEMQKYNGISQLLLAAMGIAAAAGVPVGTAWGQEAKSGVQEELTEVVVTAERRAEDVQHTAISLTAESGDQMGKDHLFNISDMQTATPSFSVNTAGQYNSINIRGIGNAAVNPAITPGIAVQRDGLIQAETIELSEPFYDIADTEILRGPQGTFIGQSSTGGAVLINSRSPTFDGVNGYINTLVGNYSDNKVDGAVNLPVSSTLALRIAFNWEHRGSFYFDEGAVNTHIPITPSIDPGHVSDQNVRISLLWRPSDSFQALLKIENNHASTGGTPDQPNQNVYIDPTTGLPVHSPFYAYSTHQPFVLNDDRQDRLSDEANDRFGLELKYTLPNGILLRSLTGFQHDDIRENVDDDATSANAIYEYHLIGPDNNYESQEFNIISPDTSKLTWIAGASWFYRNTPVRDAQYFNPGPPYLPYAAPDEITQLSIHAVQRTSGAFAQASYQIADPLQVQLGVRENWDYNFNTGGIGINIPAAGLTIPVSLTGQFHDSVPTWKAGLNYTPTATEFIYAFVARGYKSGGVNAGSPVNFDPEHVTDYELGIKSKFMDGHIETQLGGYYNNYENLQQPITNPVTGGGGVTNVGASKIKGIEASIQAHLAGFNANAGIAYNDTSLGAVSLIATYRLPPSANNLPQCVGGATVGCFNYDPYVVNLSGGANPFSPKITFDAGVDYAIQINSATLRPRITFTHVDKQYASLFQTDNYFLMNARNLLGASLAYETGPWVGQIYGTNLTNQVYVSAYNGNDEFYGAPRQFGVRLSRTF